MEKLTPYNKELILNQLALEQHQRSTIEVKIHETIPSTNDYLLSTPWENKIMVCLAEAQTKGRGRFGRNWYSPFGQNIYLSIGISIAKEISELMGLSLIIGIAIINAFKEYGIDEKFLIKWPNDIVWQNKKIAGILINANAELHGNCKLIIGLGINLNMTECPMETNLKPWTSLRLISGHTIDKNKMASLLIDNILTFSKKFEVKGLSAFITLWNDYDYLRNKFIKLKVANVEEQGIAQGIDQHGRLILLLSNGHTKAFSCGDATVYR